MQLFDDLQRAINKYADRNAFFIHGIFYKYADFAEKISEIRKSIQLNTLETEKNIGLVANDDLETYAAIIALWFEGKTYVPLSPETPLDRNENIIQQAFVKTIIDSSLKTLFSGYTVIESRKLPTTPIDLVPKTFSDRESVYLLFTSGTTGQPKGVPISRANLTGFIAAFGEMGIDIDENDRCLQMFELTFDLSVMSYLVPLLKGACVYTIPKDKIKYSYIFELMDEQKLTVALMVPSILHFLRPYFSEIDSPEMKYSLFCGEALPLDITEEWSRCLPNSKILNVYGPTEDTIFCTHYNYNRTAQNKSHNGILSIGKEMTGTMTIIIDENNKVLPIDSIGQLCLGGIQLTPGYWKNEEKNNEAFFYTNYQGREERFYKTGDLCRRDKDGDILYIGRVDFQTKIQGFRVELSEVEFFCKSHLDKVNVVAVAITNKTGNTEIGLVIESEEFKTDKLLEYLRLKLPAYMIPTQIIFNRVFPLNINGKTDRKLLVESFKNPLIQVGQRVTSTHTVTQEKINDFAKLTGDYNPIHFDEVYAASTIFKRKIAHGPYILTFITTMFANKLPGPGTVYLSHDVKYLFPVYIGDVITASIEIIEILPNKHIIAKTVCINQDEIPVIEGIARLKKF